MPLKTDPLAKASNRISTPLTILSGITLGSIFLISPLASYAKPPPGLALDPELHAWFERQHNIVGGWCCDISDGFVLEEDDWRINATGNGYQVNIEGAWRDVPAHTMRDAKEDDPNPTGKAIVWYRVYNDNPEPMITIFCFTPGTLD